MQPLKAAARQWIFLLLTQVLTHHQAIYWREGKLADLSTPKTLSQLNKKRGQ